jgi:hypothetical protein
VPQPDDSPEVPVTTSTPVEIPQEQHAMFREVLGVLEENKVPFAVAGAFALQEHTGICRWTKDLDIFLTAANTPLALNSLRGQGFECEITDPVWLAKAWREDFFVDLITGMSNAVIVVEDSWIERAKTASIHEVKTRVLAPEELLASKLFVVRRERFDGADIAHVIYGTRGKLDWNRIMSLVGEHWEILLWELVLYRYVYPAHSNYVPVEIWRTLLDRFQSAISRPTPNAEFRGSLVDDNMFAVDVNDWGMPNLLERYRERRVRQIAEVRQKPAV